MAKNAPSAAARAAQQPPPPAAPFRSSAVPLIAIALALAGVALGYILTRNFFQHNVLGAATGCAVNAYVDCDRVSSSPFAAIGPVPISAFGIGLHGAVLAALAVAHFGRARVRVRDALVAGSAALAVAATVVSVALAVISIVVIRALCLYCTALQIVNLALAGILVFGTAGGAAGRLRLRQALRALAGPALGAGVLTAGIGAGMAVVATYGLANAADQQLLERQIQDARASQRLADQYLGFDRHQFDATDSPQLGDPDAPITLVVFADYNCPHCRNFDPRISEIARADANVRLVYKFFPLDGTCNRSIPRDRRSTSCAAAAAAYAAHQEGKFWEYSETLFANFQRYGPNRLVEYAAHVGMSDPERVRTALDDRTVRAKIDADVSEALAAGLRATPTMYVNGRQFLTARVPPNRDQFSVIRAMLAEGVGR